MSGLIFHLGVLHLVGLGSMCVIRSGCQSRAKAGLLTGRLAGSQLSRRAAAALTHTVLLLEHGRSCGWDTELLGPAGVCSWYSSCVSEAEVQE